MRKHFFLLLSGLAIVALMLGACLVQGGQPQFLLAPRVGLDAFEKKFEAIATPPLEFDVAKTVPPKPPMKTTKKCNDAWAAWGSYTGGTMKKKATEMTREGHRLYSQLVTFCFYQGGITGSGELTISTR